MGALWSRVRHRFRGRLCTCGVSTWTRGFWSERFCFPYRIILLLVLLLEMSQDIFSVGSYNRPHLLENQLTNWATRLFFMWSLLLCHFVKLVKLPCIELCKLRHKNPEVSAKKKKKKIIRVSSNRWASRLISQRPYPIILPSPDFDMFRVTVGFKALCDSVSNLQ